jgi:hypothetical protein
MCGLFLSKATGRCLHGIVARELACQKRSFVMTLDDDERPFLDGNLNFVGLDGMDVGRDMEGECGSSLEEGPPLC